MTTVGNDFPVCVKWTPFAKSSWSCLPTKLNQRIIIVGKNQATDDTYTEEFYDVFVNKKQRKLHTNRLNMITIKICYFI